MDRSNQAIPDAARDGAEVLPQAPYLTVANLMSRNPALAARFAVFYRKLKQMSARQRRWLLKKAAVTVTGAALLLAMSGAPAHALTINVAPGEVIVADDGACSLREAIDNANNTTTGQTHTDCAAGNPGGADTIVLPNGSTFNVPNYVDYYYGYTGLPPVTSNITIQGNGSTIQRKAAKDFRLMAVVNSGNLTLNDLTLSDGEEPYGYGGAVLVYTATLTVNNSTLTGNRAENGGAIGATYYSTVTVNNSTITDNSAYYGGAIYLNYASATIEGTTISGNTADSGSGGAIHQFGYLNEDLELQDNLIIRDSQLVDNVASYDGGALSIVSSNLVIENTTISGNEALDGYGGAGYLTDSDVTITGSEMSNNSAYSAGGLSVLGSTLTMSGSQITGNVATDGNTGGIGFYTSQATISNTPISNNTAEVAGGGIYSQESEVTVTDSTIAGNTANQGDGGGVMVEAEPENPNPDPGQQFPSNVVLRRVTVTGNMAVNGGAVAANAEGTLQIENGSLAGNTASGDGGGLHAEDATGKVTLSGVAITGNTAGDDGGGVHVRSALVSIGGGALSGNEAGGNGGGAAVSGEGSELLLSGPNVATNEAAGNGGGVFVGEDGVLDIRATTLSANEASSGGGVATAGQATIDGGSLSANIARGAGGGLSVLANGRASVSRTSLSDNEASGSGGGVAVALSGEAELIGATINGNTAVSGGGAMALGALTLSDSNVNDNSASANGGGLATIDGTILAETTGITGNTAGGDGGGLFASGASALFNLNRSLVAGNTATNGGGAGTGAAGFLAITNSTIANNEANRGGGIDALNNVTVTNATVSGNSASNGGGLRNGATGDTELVRSLFVGNNATTGREAQNQGGLVSTNAFNIFGFNGNPGLAGMGAGDNDLVPTTTLANIIAAALGSNGGPTQTLALPDNSPAIDFAPSASCVGAPTNNIDQRGAERNQDGDGQSSANECDAGAFEEGQVAGNQAFVPIVRAP